jgi:hypothetical protein
LFVFDVMGLLGVGFKITNETSANA